MELESMALESMALESMVLESMVLESMVLELWTEYATATTLPSSEYVDEKVVRSEYASLSNPEGMAPSGPPVWRSQLMSRLLPIIVKR